MESFADTGFILRIAPHGEDSAVVHLFTAQHGRMAGYVPKARARSDLRGLLQTGQHVSFRWSARHAEQLGTITLEPDDSNELPLWSYTDAAKAALQSMMQLMDRTVPERQTYDGLYDATMAVCGLLDNDDVWPILYVRWELGLLAILGYGLKLDACVVTGETAPDALTHVSPKSGGAVCTTAAAPYLHKLLKLPPFIRGILDPPPTPQDITDGLALSGHFLFERLLDPLGKALPEIRTKIIVG